MGSLLRIFKAIDQAVRGGVSWHAAWQAIKDEIKENWPDALPYIGAGLLAMSTWLHGGLPWAILAGVVAFSAIYCVRVMSGLRRSHIETNSPKRLADGTSDVSTADNSGTSSLWLAAASSLIEDLKSTTEQYGKLLTRLDGDVAALMSYDRLLSEYIIVSNALTHVPDLDYSSKMEDKIKAADKYVDYVFASFKHVGMLVKIVDIVDPAGFEAQARFGDMSRDKIPSDVHPDTFRRYLISKARLNKTIDFLRDYYHSLPNDERFNMMRERIRRR